MSEPWESPTGTADGTKMGVVLMLLASASFATMAALVKAIGPGVPLAELVFLRCLLAAPVFFVFIRRQHLPVLVAARQVLLWRTSLGLAAMFCFFYALTHMPLAECIFIGRTQPLFLALFAPYVVRESAPRAAWAAIGTGLAGVALIMQPAGAWSAAGWAALAGAIGSALAHLLVRRLNRTDYPLVIVFNFIVLSGLVTGVFALPRLVALSARQWLLVTGVAIFASLGQILMTSAYRRDRAPAVAAASYSSVVLSVLYGYFFWQEKPAALALFGAALVVAGGLLLLRARFGSHEPAAW